MIVDEILHSQKELRDDFVLGVRSIERALESVLLRGDRGSKSEVRSEEQHILVLA